MDYKPLSKIGLALAALGLLAGCSFQSPFLSKGKVRIVVSFYPLEFMVRQVAGDHAEVVTVIPSGLDPHDYDPTPKGLSEAYSGQLFLYSGASLEPWADRIRPELESEGIKVIKMSEHVDLLSATTGQTTQDETQADPHIWLDPFLAQKQTEVIRDALVSIDPSNAEDYRENADLFLRRLKALDADFRSGLSSCKVHTVILSHGAFRYLAHRYGFRILSIAGLSPEGEPSPKDFVRLVAQAKRLGLHYIFFERRTNPKLAETLAAEIGGETLDLYHIDGGFTAEESADQNLYPDLMRKNLANLRKAMNCL
jgi:zinc transport system substrate-binding protein